LSVVDLPLRILGDKRMLKKQLILSACFIGLLAGNTYAQATDPAIGVWKTIDDKTNQPASLIKIEEANGFLQGTIIKTFPAPGETPLVYCNLCKDDRKDKPLIGMKIMSDLKKDGAGTWSDGKILDPKNGETYKVKVATEDGKKMDVRGYIGVPLLGRTQVWYKAEQ
jgi:uncharacterized protein (DUF2147 family)